MTRKLLALIVAALLMSVLTLETAGAAPIAGKVTIKIVCDRGWTSTATVQLQDEFGQPVGPLTTVSCGGKSARAVVSAPGAFVGNAGFSPGTSWNAVSAEGVDWSCAGAFAVNDPAGVTCPGFPDPDVGATLSARG
jgi:hypothetical protein